MAGAGDLLLNLFQGPRPDAQIAAALNPTAGPQAAPGGPQAPQGPQMAPAQAPAPDPVNANLTALLLQQYRRDQASAGIDRGLTTMAAGFGGSPQGVHDLMASAANIQPQNTLGAVGDIMKIQSEQTAQQEHAHFMAGAAGLSSLFPGSTPNQMVEAANAGVLPEMMRARFGQMGPTEQMKNVDAAAAAYQVANPNAKPQDIAAFRANLLAGAMGGTDLGQRQYLADLQAGRTSDNYPTWVAKIQEQTKVAESANQTKLDAKETFPEVSQNWQTAEQNIEWLQNHRAATAAAIRWGAGAGDRAGQWNPFIDKDTADARGKLDLLSNENFRAGLVNTKNVRSVTEANKLGASVTNLDKSSNSDQAINDALNTMTTQIQTSRGNLIAAAGKTVPAKYTGKVDSNYLNPQSPLYNGATMEELPKGQSPGQAAQGAPPQAAIDHLKGHPELAPAFDAKYGPGASKRALGQ